MKALSLYSRKFLTSRPDSGDQILAETLFEFLVERFERVEEGLAVNLLDYLHAAFAHLFEPLGSVKPRSPARSPQHAALAAAIKHSLVRHGIELVRTSSAIGDEGNRRKEMSGEGEGCILNFVKKTGWRSSGTGFS